MSKSKHAKPEEFLLEKVRSLEKLNKALRKRLKQLEKNKHVYEELKLNDEIEEELEPKKEAVVYCPDCGKGKLIQRKVLNYVWKECDLCPYETKRIKL